MTRRHSLPGWSGGKAADRPRGAIKAASRSCRRLETLRCAEEGRMRNTEPVAVPDDPVDSARCTTGLPPGSRATTAGASSPPREGGALAPLPLSPHVIISFGAAFCVRETRASSATMRAATGFGPGRPAHRGTRGDTA